MNAFRILAAVAVATLTLGAAVAVAQPVANAGGDKTAIADYHQGQYVQVKGQKSTPKTGLTYQWSVVSGGPVEWLSSTSTEELNPVGFFPVGTTTVKLTVTNANKKTSSDTATVTVIDETYRSHVLSYRPWAQDLPQLSVDILAGIDAVLADDPDNGHLQIAQDAAEVAAFYERVCYDVQFVDSVTGHTYSDIATRYYFVARAWQVQHHEGVAVHFYFGTGTVGTPAQQALIQSALDAGRYDLEQWLARSSTPVQPAPYPTSPSL